MVSCISNEPAVGELTRTTHEWKRQKIRRGKLILEMMPHAKSPKKFNWRAWVMRLCVMNVSRIQRVTLEKSKKVTSWRPDHQKQNLLNKILHLTFTGKGCCHSSVDSSATSILPPGFESQSHHLCFYHLLSNMCYICHVKRMKINERGRVWPIF